MRTISTQPTRPQVQACRPKVSICTASVRVAPAVVRRDVSAKAGGRAKTTEETGPFLQKDAGEAIRDGFDNIVDAVKGDKNYESTQPKDYNKNYEKAGEVQEDLKNLRQDLYGNAATKAQAAADAITGKTGNAADKAKEVTSKSGNKAENSVQHAKNEAGKTAQHASEQTGNYVEKGMDAIKDSAAKVAETVKNVAN